MDANDSSTALAAVLTGDNQNSFRYRQLPEGATLVSKQQFRNPHHTISDVALPMLGERNSETTPSKKDSNRF